MTAKQIITKEKRKEYNDRFRTKNPNYQGNYQKFYYSDKPWVKTYFRIKQRCLNPKTSSFKYYGGRGIKCLITKEELKVLWFRDGADKMSRPSIDRIHYDGHYEFANCQYLETSVHAVKTNKDQYKKYNDILSGKRKITIIWLLNGERRQDPVSAH